MSTKAEPGVIGAVYKVVGEDCCVSVWFTARLEKVTYDESDVNHEYPTYFFDNGVEITGFDVVLTKQD